MELLSVVIFAVTLSMDGFGAGIVYGMRKIRVPFTSLLVVGVASSSAIAIAMVFGHFVSNYVSIKVAELAGAMILIIMGLRMVALSWSGPRKCMEESGDEVTNVKPDGVAIVNFRIKCLGLVIKILRQPTVADLDQSGHIGFKEALFLSLALAIDALVAGFGASMAGFRPMLTPLIVGPVSASCVGLGVALGRRYAVNWLGEKAAVLPGWVLIFLGLARVIKI